MKQLSDDQIKAVIEAIVAGQHHDPHSVLGVHRGPDGTVIIRALRPLATSVTAVLADGTRIPMRHVHNGVDRKSTRLNSSHVKRSRMPSSA